MLERAVLGLRRQSTARAYGQKLGRHLAQDYGASTIYTAAQIESAVRRHGLPLKGLAIAYAGFMAEPEFLQVAPEGDYKALRKELAKYLANPVSPRFEPASENWVAFLGASGHFEGSD